MLIDRVPTHKAKKQVFGSRMGVLSSPKTRRDQIKKWYVIKRGAAAGYRERLPRSKVGFGTVLRPQRIWTIYFRISTK
jgi:hypothetical protein